MKTYIKLAEAHIEAKLNNKWDFDHNAVINAEQIKEALVEGKTIHALLDSIEISKISITSIIMCGHFGAVSTGYRQAVRKAFKQLCTNLNIK